MTAPDAPGGARDGLPGIAIHGLTKRYGQILALDGLDLVVPPGSLFGLLGPNGAGKTTTIKLLVGLTHATRGSISITRSDAAPQPGELRIGYLDQEPRYYGWMTGRELLRLVGDLDGLRGAELEARVAETLERIGLLAAGDRRIGGYSSGMRQRLGIGQALVARPELIVLDEPAASLDPEGRRDVLALIQALRGTATVIVSSHILADVERVCDRVAILDRGRLVTEAPLPELLARHRRLAYRLVPDEGQPGAVHRLSTGLGGQAWVAEVTVERDAESPDVLVRVRDEAEAARSILPAIAQTGVALESFERVQPTLEDVFLELVGPARAEDVDGRGFVRPRMVSSASGGPTPSAGGGPTPTGAPATPSSSTGAPVTIARPALAGLRPMLRKELVEQWRTLRLPLVAAVLALLGFSSPLLAYFTPELLKAVGGPIQITLPPPTAADAVGQLLKNVGQFGLLIAIVLAMGSVAAEKERGTAGMLLAHAASRSAFLVSKLVAIAVTLAIGVLVAFAAAWFYTLVLFEAPSVGGFVASAWVQWLELFAFASVTFLGSVLTRSTAAAAGLAIAGLIVLGILGVVPTLSEYLPTGLATPAAQLALGRPADPLLGPIAAGVALVIALAVIAWLVFRRQEI